LIEIEEMARIYKIRKLTPKECMRLMGVKDEDFQKMKEEAAEYRKEPKEDEEEESSGDEFPPPWDEEADKAFLDEHAEKTNLLIGKADEILEEKFPPHSRMMD
jgi:hypothetical protein